MSQNARVPDQGPADPLLRLFAQRADRQGLELEITLQIGGLLVSGLLTSPARYNDGLEDQISDGLASIDPGFRPREASGGEAEADPAPDSSGFIHLRNACISSLRVGPVIHAPVWRGRLSAVDGFVLGVPDHLKADSQLQAAYGH